MYHGMMTIYKEAGYTSSDVVARLRGILHMKKIGHTGTLDPDAEGVLPVCLGNGTKLCELIADRDKEYVAVMRLGTVTDTQDMSGEVLSKISDEEVAGMVTEAVESPPPLGAPSAGLEEPQPANRAATRSTARTRGRILRVFIFFLLVLFFGF